MDVSETALGVAAPYQRVARIDFQRIRALAPTCQLDADVVDECAALQLEGNPCRAKMTVVLPFAQLVVVETFEGIGMISAGHDAVDAHAHLGVSV